MTKTKPQQQLENDVAQWICDWDDAEDGAWPLYLVDARDFIKYMKARGYVMRPSALRAAAEFESHDVRIL